MSDLFTTLKQQKLELLAAEKPPRAREAAKQLNISEAEYVALSCGDSVYALNTELLVELIKQLHRIGEVMALTRNDAVVFEHHGIYHNPIIKQNYVIINQADMDLRLKISDWQYAFAVDEGGRQSFHFFDAYGQAAHKIYMTKKSDLQVYDDLVSQFSVNFGFEKMNVQSKPKDSFKPNLPAVIDEKSLQADWQKLDNPHHIDSLLQLYGLTRPQAYRHLPDVATKLQKNVLRPLLEQAAEHKWPLLIFVPNSCATQIHNGTVHKLLEMGPWFNVLDPKFNMHASLQLITETWLVIKNSNGESTLSLELFDANDQAVMMVYLQPSSRTPEIIKQWQDFLMTQKLEGMSA